VRRIGEGFRATSPKEEVRLLNKLLLAQRGSCFYCNRHISLRKFFSSLRFATVDHFFPLALGGRDHISNVVLACGRCNRRKGSRRPTLEELTNWNVLAQVWPHITAVTVELHMERKLCGTCGNPITLDRLLESRKSGKETRACSSLCAQAEKRERRARRRVASLLNGDSSDDSNLESRQQDSGM
jgi:hypothetical protein